MKIKCHLFSLVTVVAILSTRRVDKKYFGLYKCNIYNLLTYCFPKFTDKLFLLFPTLFSCLFLFLLNVSRQSSSGVHCIISSVLAENLFKKLQIPDRTYSKGKWKNESAKTYLL